MRWLLLTLIAACGEEKTARDTGRVDTAEEAGILTIRALYLDAFLAESTLVTGPDGTTVLIDVGSDDNGAEVAAALAGDRVDWIVLTHYHADHIGGWKALLHEEGVSVTRGIVSRGPHDLSDGGASSSNWEDLCEDLEGDYSGRRYDLCSGSASAPCDISDRAGTWPADRCDGLLQGRLDDPGDDGPSWIDLGAGARMVFYAADAFACGGTKCSQAGVTVGTDDDGENARSLVGVVEWGDFSWLFAGDLTGGGKDTPDIESFVAATVGEDLVPSDAVDVAKLSHHGISSSTNEAWVQRFFSGSGRNRHAVVNSTSWTVSSPSQDVLDVLVPHLGEGSVWATAAGWAAGGSDHLVVMDADVEIRVSEEGYTIGSASTMWDAR